MIFIDTNIFIRFLMNDHKEMYEKSRKLFESIADSNETYIVEDSVVAEILHVTTSKKLYNQPRLAIVARLNSILENKNIYHHHKPALLLSLEKYATTNLDFVDCLALAYQELKITSNIISFDSKLV